MPKYFKKLFAISWLDVSEKQMKKTLKDKILEIVPAKCDSWIICDVYVFDRWIVCDFVTYIFDHWLACDFEVINCGIIVFLTYLLLITLVCILSYLDDTLE